MNAPLHVPSVTASHPDLDTAIADACARIAPAWPLDRQIAVNPHWGRVATPVAQAASELALHAGARLLPPSATFRAAWRDGRVTRAQLAAAIAECGADTTPEDLLQALGDDAPADPLPLFSDCVDATRDALHAPPWRDFITQQVSQFCAAYFDTAQADWQIQRHAGLYRGWREHTARDRGARLLMAAPAVQGRARLLPDTPREVVALALARLAPRGVAAADFLYAHLAALLGWAAWCAWLGWQARLEGRDDQHLLELLAVRLGWELLLDDGARHAGSPWHVLEQAWQGAGQRTAALDRAQAPAWLWQRALELGWQQPLARALAARGAVAPAEAAPALQAVFCIDVRSEPLRRALESAWPDIETRGFAGFFGLPVEYAPLGTAARRAHLPGLLAPTLLARDEAGAPEVTQALASRRARRLDTARDWAHFQGLPASAFAGVETLGLGYLLKLAQRCFARPRAAAPAGQAGLAAGEVAALRPRLALAPAEGAALAARVLRAMGLGARLAPLVLLVGHGARCANNPHAAGLACGACGGHSGELSARLLAGLLNDPAVRAALPGQGVTLPASTHFVAALHDTTTDEITLFDTDALPAECVALLARFRAAARVAGDVVRRARAPALGLAVATLADDVVLSRYRARAADWAETRPEWGLAGNAAFIVAPRARTRGLDLEGRAFLHDYDWRLDGDGTTLELIMTAPMLVTHWINWQYLASTVDPARSGSGNKVLHNVVGGRVGVFEGNAGDLRIGLPWQSVHDGEKFVHEPLRLAVYIEAPRVAIDAVLARHATVRNLVMNGWLHLHAIEPADGLVWRRGDAGWQPAV